MDICPNTERGRHIRCRCAGCGSKHSTKNIGRRIDNGAPGEIEAHRSIFDVDGGCRCKDPAASPVVHVCGQDCEQVREPST